MADNRPRSASKLRPLRNGHWQKFELAGASGYQTQGAPQILVGSRCGWHRLLRILWPTGVLQDEIDLPKLSSGRGVIAMKEADRRGSSCPVLFAWTATSTSSSPMSLAPASSVMVHAPAPQHPQSGEWVQGGWQHRRACQRQAQPALHGADGRVNYIDHCASSPSTIQKRDSRILSRERSHESSVRIRPRGRSARRRICQFAAIDAMAMMRLPRSAVGDHTFAAASSARAPYDGFANLP